MKLLASMTLRSQLLRVGCAAVCASLLTGCHTYRVVDSPPAVGSTVRVHVPVASPLIGANRAPQTATVEGHLLTAADTIVMATRTRRHFGAFRELVQVDTFRLAATDASRVEVREFSGARSVTLGVVVAAGAALLAFAAFDFGPPGDPPDPLGQEQSAVVFQGSMVSSLLGLVFR